MDFKVTLVFLSVVVGWTVGQLRCYSCSFSTVETDQSCLETTNSTNSIECSMAYCVIVRQEFLDPPGTIASFLRGCDDEPDYLNHDVTDNMFRTYYRACTTDLCNTGNGIESVVGGNLDPNPQVVGDNLLVPGTAAATAGRLEINVLILFSIIFVFILRQTTPNPHLGC